MAGQMIMGVFQRPPYLPRGDALMTRDGDGKTGSPEYAIPMLLMAVIQGGWPTRKESVNIFDRVRIMQLSTRASETRGRGEHLFWLYEEDQDNNSSITGFHIVLLGSNEEKRTGSPSWKTSLDNT